MLESLLEALQFSPNNIPLKLQIAKLYMQQGSFAEAEQQLIEIIDLDNNHIEAKYELASCFYKQQKITAAEVLLEEIIGSMQYELEPNFKDVFFNESNSETIFAVGY